MKVLKIILIGVVFYFMVLKMTKMGLSKRISKNFNMSELVVTNKPLPNSPDKKAMKNLERVVTKFLQPLRDYLGEPIIVTSGYRSSLVNAAVGGDPNSQHLKGEAVDFVVENVSNADIIRIAKSLGLPFDQLIDELKYKSDGSFSRWIHVSLKNSNNRGEILRARNSPQNLKMKYVNY